NTTDPLNQISKINTANIAPEYKSVNVTSEEIAFLKEQEKSQIDTPETVNFSTSHQLNSEVELIQSYTSDQQNFDNKPLFEDSNLSLNESERKMQKNKPINQDSNKKNPEFKKADLSEIPLKSQNSEPSQARINEDKKDNGSSYFPTIIKT